MSEPEDLKKVTYAIIGGCGFLGQHLVHSLLTKESSKTNIVIKVIDRAPNLKALDLLYPEDFSNPVLELYLGVDITEQTTASQFLRGVDVVFHLAAYIAYGRKNKALLKAVNIKGIENIVQNAKDSGVKKIIYVSSFAALGCLDQKDKTKMASEDCENNWEKEPFCHYGLSKYHGEQTVLSANDKDFTTLVAVPGILLGPGPCHHASILPFQIALTKKWTLVPTGGSSFIDVRDAAEGLRVLATHQNAKGKYLLVSYNLEHRDLMHEIAQVAGRTLHLMAIPRLLRSSIAGLFSIIEWFLPLHSPFSREGMVKAFRYRYFSHQKATQELGWTPQYGLNETLKDAITWLRLKKVL